eukprot:CAMPEP_0172470114 /NCGR_PEP_ID=MMETSP1065-20121228/65524_1 /TAXON_ID=265537 /ORGANISM="Amphiprora paludosa, Strain CCMP125" /LENGTH=68 /DNA_ID=CAMNT_0013227961 /DNA_START=135 /DNA_END=338 /DNA_ORIENTATION=+
MALNAWDWSAPLPDRWAKIVPLVENKSLPRSAPRKATRNGPIVIPFPWPCGCDVNPSRGHRHSLPNVW